MTEPPKGSQSRRLTYLTRPPAMGSSLISHPKNTVATLNAYKMHWLHLSLYTVLRFELQAAKTNLSSAAKSKLMAHYVWNQLGSSCVFTPHRSISHDRSARFQTGHFIAANESMRLCRSIRDDLNGPYPDGQKPLADAQSRCSLSGRP